MTASGGALSQAASPDRPPAIQALDDWTQVSALISGRTHERTVGPRPRRRPKRGHDRGRGIWTPAPADRIGVRQCLVRDLAGQDAGRAGVGLRLSFHSQATLRHGDQWRVFGGYTDRTITSALPASGRLTADRLADGPIGPPRRSGRARKRFIAGGSSREAADAARAHVWRRHRAHTPSPPRRRSPAQSKNASTACRRASGISRARASRRTGAPRRQCVRGRSHFDLQQDHHRCVAPLRFRRWVDARRGTGHPLEIAVRRDLHELGPGHRVAAAAADRRQPIRRSSEARTAGLRRSGGAHRRHLSLDWRSAVGRAADRTRGSRHGRRHGVRHRSIRSCGGR